MTATSFDVDTTLLQELSEDLEIPCDYGDSPWHTHGPARWVGHAKCPFCERSVERLLCEPCHDLIVATESGCYCSACDNRIIPFRHVFVRFEPIGRAA